MKMIPTSYLFKDLYREYWGDPTNPHAVKVHDQPTLLPPDGCIGASHIWDALLGKVRRPFAHGIASPGKEQPCS
jgi:hypothetical protein